MDFMQTPIGYNEATHVRPKNCPFPWIDPQTQLPVSSLDTSDLPSQTASISDLPFCHNALDIWTDTHAGQQMIGGNVP